ncbi:hypothetical protein HDU96_001189, partial [Phlyctochytrium bullatum]
MASPNATPNDCKILADSFPTLDLQATDTVPAICCNANLTAADVVPTNAIGCRAGRIVS